MKGAEMEKRKWTSQQKFQIVMEGLKGNAEISKLCNKYQVSQTQFYKWRDQFIKYGSQAFEVKNVSKKEERLENENRKLKGIIGELTVELKKNDYDL